MELPNNQTSSIRLAAAFSRDGKQIAYDWYFEAENPQCAAGSCDDRRRRNRRPERYTTMLDIATISPTDWSPDGRWIAVVIRRKDRTAQIGMVNVADASLRVLKTVDWAGVGGLRFSPDGSMLAYHRPAREGAFERDVFVIAADGAREVIAAGGPSDDSAARMDAHGARFARLRAIVAESMADLERAHFVEEQPTTRRSTS